MGPQESKSNLQDPLYAKVYLTDFSSEAVKKSQMKTRQLQKDDQLFCEICMRMYRLHEFKMHIQQHKRKPQSKIPLVPVFYNYESKQQMSKVSDKSIIDGLQSQDRTLGLNSGYFDVIPASQQQNQAQSNSLSPQKQALRFYANYQAFTRFFNQQRCQSQINKRLSKKKIQEESPRHSYKIQTTYPQTRIFMSQL